MTDLTHRPPDAIVDLDLDAIVDLDADVEHDDVEELACEELAGEELAGDGDGGSDASCFRRDPSFIEEALPYVERALAWFSADIRGMDALPEAGPFLMAGNHCGGLYMPDALAFMARWYRTHDPAREMYALAYDLLFLVPGLGPVLNRLGGLPASQTNAAAALDRGAGVMVYPGGDEDAYRPWVDRHHIDLHGHKGFVKLALRTGVPLFPVVSHGSHDSIVVLFRGERIARTLGLHRLRINVFPILAGLPWGIAPVWPPMVPMPSHITVQVCEPFDWSDLGPEAADDPDVVDRCYAAVLGRMQACLDDLAAEIPHPVQTRLRNLVLRR